MAFEQATREATDFATLPASDGRFGPDPYRLIGLPVAEGPGRFAGLLRGADRIVVLDADARELASAPTPHDPTDLVARAGELLVVGTGSPRVARYDAATLAPGEPIALPGAIAPRAIAATPTTVWVSDEHRSTLHELREQGGRLDHAAVHDYCRGPIQLHAIDDLVVGVCLLEHRVRVDRSVDGALETLATIEHDGPIWSLTVGPESASGSRLLALTGVEDHPLERRDGGFNYIDSFAFVYELSRDGVVSRRAAVNVSEHGIVTPKWSRWLASSSGAPMLVLAGFATPDLLTLTWAQPEGFGAHPQAELSQGAPGTRDAVVLGEGELLAADALLDRWLRVDASAVTGVAIASAEVDRRSFEERVGEALVFTTAMAPWNSADGERSRFTCETCHFEGRTDGRVHFTGREREGAKVHAVSKPLLGLFPNRPHFTRALDRSTATMIDNEFGVANRFSGRDPWFDLGPETLPWLAQIPGWPESEAVDGELLRRALLRFLIRFSMPSNPAARGREGFDALEAEGAQVFARRCETCHQARLAADRPATRVAPEAWEAHVFSANAPIVWASDEYVQTAIVPWVHPEGARVSSLRRLHFKWPYFTNGGARSLEAVLEGVRLPAEGEGRADHDLGPAPAGARGLDEDERTALLAFLRLL